MGFPQNPSLRKDLLCLPPRGKNRERRYVSPREWPCPRVHLPPRSQAPRWAPCPVPGPPLHLVVLQHRRKWKVWLLWKPVGPGQPGRLPQPREWRSSPGLPVGQRRGQRAGEGLSLDWPTAAAVCPFAAPASLEGPHCLWGSMYIWPKTHFPVSGSMVMWLSSG